MVILGFCIFTVSDEWPVQQPVCSIRSATCCNKGTFFNLTLETEDFGFLLGLRGVINNKQGKAPLCVLREVIFVSV